MTPKIARYPGKLVFAPRRDWPGRAQSHGEALSWAFDTSLDLCDWAMEQDKRKLALVIVLIVGRNLQLNLGVVPPPSL